MEPSMSDASDLKYSLQEGGDLLGLVPLRRQGVEADADVERQLLVHLPVVLGVPLDVRVDVLGIFNKKPMKRSSLPTKPKPLTKPKVNFWQP